MTNQNHSFTFTLIFKENNFIFLLAFAKSKRGLEKKIFFLVVVVVEEQGLAGYKTLFLLVFIFDTKSNAFLIDIICFFSSQIVSTNISKQKLIKK